ncbi:hypothetical protein BD626DRAFT_490139 [Schizophyllum amplum]|uniref:Uncharacterized protein n=1 Tax=Schizophyllum amplum TaxID=97359 RepID=A0A550CJB0_9AGAR|nr:hypothetical protein BD626DRAFT_490139 [Auriculariopsis ampla]
MIELPHTTGVDGSDDFFLERLDVFCNQVLRQAVKSFAERERRPLEQVRRSIAVWHCKQLFERTGSGLSASDSTAYISLRHISEQLESLRATASIEAFVLAVNPSNSIDDPNAGFLGGTVAGRQFWREFRHGGEAGAKAFRQSCARASGTAAKALTPSAPVPHPALSTARPTAQSIKSDLYDAMRRSLRSVSGVRSAEMKWTNQERLHAFGVRLLGWPADIPMQNPSILKTSQNAALLDALRCGALHFERINAAVGAPASRVDEDQDISWAYSEIVEEEPLLLQADSQRTHKRPRSDSNHDATQSGRPLHRE